MYMYVYKKKYCACIVCTVHVHCMHLHVHNTVHVCLYVPYSQKKKKKMSTVLLDERFILRIKSGQKFVMQGYIGVFGKIYLFFYKYFRLYGICNSHYYYECSSKAINTPPIFYLPMKWKPLYIWLLLQLSQSYNL